VLRYGVCNIASCPIKYLIQPEVPNMFYKKIFVFLAVLLLGISLSACDQYNNKDKKVDEKPETTTEQNTTTGETTQPEKNATE